RLFETWGITADSLKPRLVQAEPGIPVGRLLADGKVDIGFQQLSELISLSGIKVLGPMPPGLEIDTVFSAGVCQTSKMKTQAISFLRYLASPQTDAAKRRCGMTPV
ncbi:MAG: molybdate ABC transporter substrate-binding protein, partial [Burkholderiaceae bacterium]